jgi:hypothetical protein
MLEVISEKGKREMKAICIVYRSMFVYCRYLCGGTLVPWYIVISVTLISYCLLLLHTKLYLSHHLYYHSTNYYE